MKDLPSTPESVRKLSPAALLEHTGWMRRLVSQLVRDAAQVDDLIQDAWAAALTNPPPPGLPLRAWLTGIVQRTTLAKGRGNARRRHREESRGQEQHRSGADLAPSVADLSACADEQKFLLEALGTLPEGERAVLLLRFYEDLPPRKIAERLGVPVNTVRTRQRLGLERLRGTLDRRHDGDTSAWAMVLLPLSGASLRGVSRGAATGSGSAATGAFAAAGPALALAVLVLGAAGWWWLQGSEAPDLSRSTSADEAVATLLGPRQYRGASGAQRGSLAVVNDQAAGARSEVAPELAAANFSFRGIVVDVEGVPIVGAKVEKRSKPMPGVSYIHGRADWMPSWRESGAEGHFSAPAAEPDSVLFVTAFHPSYVSVAQVTELVPGETRTITMARTAQTTLEVEVVDDTSGEPATNFSVLAYQYQDPFADGVPQHSVLKKSASTNKPSLRVDKSFAVDRPLRVHLMQVAGSWGDSKDWALTVEVEGVEGGVTRVRFRVNLDGPETSGRYPVATGRVVDDATGECIQGAAVSTSEALETSPGKAGDEPIQRNRTVASAAGGAFTIALPKGAIEAPGQASHPLYVPIDIELTLDPTAPAETRVIRMQRRGALHGTVVDDDGRPVAGTPLLVMLPEMPGRSDRMRTVTDAAGRFEVPDLLAGRVTVFVLDSPFDADENALVSDSFRLKNGESRDVTIAVDPRDRVHVTGNVVDGASVLSEHVPVFFSLEQNGPWTVAKSAGLGFDAGGVERGHYLVALLHGDDRAVNAPVGLLPDVEVTGLGSQRLTFRMPASALRGRVTAAANAPAGGVGDLYVIAVPSTASGFAQEFLATAKAARVFGTAVSPEDGSFELPHVASGPHRLLLWRGSGKSARVISEKQLDVAGSIRLADWTIKER